MPKKDRSPGIHFIILTAYGITKEPVASNRIYGLTSGLSETVEQITTIGVNYPNQTAYDYRSAGRNIRIFAINPGILSKTFRLILRRLQKSKVTSSAEAKELKSMKTLSLALLKKVHRTLMFVFSAEGYPVPVLKLLVTTFKEIVRSIKSGQKTVVFATTGPPCIVIISSFLKKAFGEKIILVNDFRDPVYENLYIKNDTFPAILKRIERFAVTGADAVTSVSNSCILSLVEKPIRSYVLYNGYSAKTQEHIKSTETVPLSIGYLGAVYSARIEPLKQLAAALKETEFKFYYAGKHSALVKEIFRSAGTLDHLVDLGMLNKEDALTWQGKMQILLILKSESDKGVIPGKFYEYILTRKPVLVVGNTDAEFNQLSEKTGGVFIVESNAESIRNMLALLKETKEVERNASVVKNFDWKNLAYSFYKNLIEPLSSTNQESTSL